MSSNTENLVLEILRGLRSDVTDLRSESRDGFRETRARLSAIEQKIGGHIIDVVDLNARLDQLMQRIERLEKRAELIK